MSLAEAVERFRADLERLTGGAPGRIGVAVSGGPDSLALLLLAHAAYPGAVEAATVDHGLRAESAGEAQAVASLCSTLNVPHAILAAHWTEVPEANLAATARAERYRLLCGWAAERDLPWLLTAHHRDDQAETILMRLARGSGLAGLAGIRPLGQLGDGRMVAGLIRPLLGWSKAELEVLVEAVGIAAADDPSNRSEALDRTRFRALLTTTPLLDPARLAASAAWLGEAEEAMAWMTERLFSERARRDPDGAVEVDSSALPRELRRRLLLRGLGAFADPVALPGPKVARLLDALDAGEPGMLADILVHPGPPWRFERAPPRRA